MNPVRVTAWQHSRSGVLRLTNDRGEVLGYLEPEEVHRLMVELVAEPMETEAARRERADAQWSRYRAAILQSVMALISVLTIPGAY